MSQRGVEQAMGKLVTDEAFRTAFFRDPAAAATSAGLPLSCDELAALARLTPAALAAFCASVDDRICRLWLPDPDDDRQAREERAS